MPLKGATTTFAMIPAGAVANIVSIGGWTEELEAIPRRLLSGAIGTHEKFVAGDRVDHGAISMEVEFDPDTFGTVLDLDNATQAAILTFPKVLPGDTSGATLSGSGVLRLRSFETTEAGQIIKGSVEFQFDGNPAPAWAARIP
jgi:hypothetical protein